MLFLQSHWNNLSFNQLLPVMHFGIALFCSTSFVETTVNTWVKRRKVREQSLALEQLSDNTYIVPVDARYDWHEWKTMKFRDVKVASHSWSLIGSGLNRLGA